MVQPYEKEAEHRGERESMETFRKPMDTDDVEPSYDVNVDLRPRTVEDEIEGDLPYQ